MIGTYPREFRRVAVERLPLDHPARGPEWEVDPMAFIGDATTVTGDIVAHEALEIAGTVEGAVRLDHHPVTIADAGHVKGPVEAGDVTVRGRITGDVVARESVEVERDGIVDGDIKAPRVILHEGGVVVGRLDMAAALPKGARRASRAPEDLSERPHLAAVTPLRDGSADG